MDEKKFSPHHFPCSFHLFFFLYLPFVFLVYACLSLLSYVLYFFLSFCTLHFYCSLFLLFWLFLYLQANILLYFIINFLDLNLLVPSQRGAVEMFLRETIFKNNLFLLKLNIVSSLFSASFVSLTKQKAFRYATWVLS